MGPPSSNWQLEPSITFSGALVLTSSQVKRCGNHDEEPMRFPSRVDGSVCGAVLSTRPLAALGATAAAAATATSRPRVRRDGGHDASSRPLSARLGRGEARHMTTTLATPPPPSPPPSPRSAPRPTAVSPPRATSSSFCPRSSQWLLATFVRDAGDRTAAVRTQCAPRTARPYHNVATAPAFATSNAADVVTRQMPPVALASSPGQDKKHLLSLVDGGYEASVEEHFDFYRDPYRRGYATSDGPRLQVSEKRDDVHYPSQDETVKVTDRVQEVLTRLCAAIAQGQRYPNRCPLESIYRLYSHLPEPRMLHLTGQWRNRLLRLMGTPRKRDRESMLRYFALVGDVKNAGLTLRRSQWNFALAFASKYVARATTQEMDSALRLWKEMERDAGITGNDVTFNILFDVAAKAGNFTLAEMIYKEMENRGFEFNRFHHVSLIHYFGLRLDSDGIRAAYREMVESGEMIDTVTLNCVISGLLRCGEESAAEQTYQRMKEGHSLAKDIPQRDYVTNKVITKVLMMFAKIGRQHPELQKSFQGHLPLAPDLRTYKLLVDHYAIKLGDLAKVAQYLDEMKHLSIPLDATIFLSLFKGFYMHGGFSGSEWSQQRLEGVLSALYQAHDDHAKGFRIDNWLVIWALRAVRKCCQDKELIETFDLMSQRWDIKPDRQPFMHAIFENILYNKDLRSSQGRWDGTAREGRNKIPGL